MPTATNGQLAVQEKPQAPVKLTPKGVEPDSLEGLMRCCAMVKYSGLNPRTLDTEAKLCVAALYGRELGLSFMQSLQSIAVVNGKPGIYGDCARALVESSGEVEYIKESIEGDGAGMKAVCVSKRKGRTNEVRTEFSMKDAVTAGLAEKDIWRKYPKRMLQMRARGFNLRDNFGDKLSGIRTVEELQDIDESPMQSGATIGHQDLDIVEQELIGTQPAATPNVAEPFVGDPRLPTKEELAEMAAEGCTVQDEIPF